MDVTQLSQMVMQNTKDIAQLQSDVNSANRRIDENDRLTQGIHQLAENVAAMSVEVKLLTGKVDTSIDEIKSNLKEHGERINAIEKEPAQKWNKLSWLVISGVVTAILGFVIGKFL